MPNRLDSFHEVKIEKAQKALGARTETETIERALEIVIGEDGETSTRIMRVTTSSSVGTISF